MSFTKYLRDLQSDTSERKKKKILRNFLFIYIKLTTTRELHN